MNRKVIKMILVLKQNPEKEKVDSLIRMLGEKGLSTNVSEGESHTIIGLIGDTSHLPVDLISALDIVENVTRVSSRSRRQTAKCTPITLS